MKSGDTRFDGNCGMFAIALVEAARRVGLDALIVLAYAAESEEQFHQGRFHLYHVAVDLGGVLCDARGRIPCDEDLLSFMDPPPTDAKIERFVLDSHLAFTIRRKTRWTVSFEKYAGDAARLVTVLGRAGSSS